MEIIMKEGAINKIKDKIIIIKHNKLDQYKVGNHHKVIKEELLSVKKSNIVEENWMIK